MTQLPVTPPQTVGPFFHDCLLHRDVREIAADATTGRIRIEGTVRDGAGQPVDDAMVEIWQADAAGRYCHPADAGQAPAATSFIGYGRAGTDDHGKFWFVTVKPGAVAAPRGGTQAPHLVVQVLARGLLDALTTRMYFGDDPANDDDLVLAAVPDARRATLVAKPSDDDPSVYRFDIVLQGEGETVFFDVDGRRRR